MPNASKKTSQSYEGIQMLTWLGSDINLVQTWAGNIFAGSLDPSDPAFKILLAATFQSINEAQDDLNEISKFLQEYNEIKN